MGPAEGLPRTLGCWKSLTPPGQEFQAIRISLERNEEQLLNGANAADFLDVSLPDPQRNQR